LFLGIRHNVRRLQLFELLSKDSLVSQANTVAARKKMVKYIQSKMPGIREEEVLNKISFFSNKIVIRWKASGKNKKSFLKRNEDWLNQPLCQPTNPLHQRDITATPKSQLRAVKEFHSLTDRSKRRLTQALVSNYSPEKLAFASQSSYTKIGKRNIAYVLKKAAGSSPRSLRELKKVQRSKSAIEKHSAEEALALIVDTKLTRAQYLKLRKAANNKRCNLYPSYDEVLIAKKECYPNDIQITETKGEIKLQSLLDHTVRRLAIVQADVLSRVVTEGVTTLHMTYKWGFDGSSNHSIYKQKFQESCDSIDSDLFLTSVVPLKMSAEHNTSEEIVWINPRSSSTRFCIPIKFQFVKETQDIIKQESEYIEQQIATLLPTRIVVQGKIITVQHNLLKTMLDGKVANALAENPSTQSCYICKAKPKDMNNLSAVMKKPCNVTTFEYGLSTLHAHIRFFECILHISYRLNIKTWQVRGARNKSAYEEKKQEVISKFRQETGLLVDTVKQGSGSTNDGNTARRFFKDPKKAAEITKVDETLIRRFSYILQAISCGYQLNTERFREYAMDTAKRFINLYGWYKMPASVHKILIHGADVMDTLLLPIGQLSEEALEARHKECRYVRENNTRKIGRKQNIEDLLHALLVSSDMVISSLRPLPKRKLNKLSEEVLRLLRMPEITPQTPTTEEDTSDKPLSEESSESDVDSDL